MGHEIGQFGIPDCQMLVTNAQQRVGMARDIGEAKVTHSIFGGARVRVIRERDKKRRVWLLTALLLTAIAAIWQGWSAWHRMQNADGESSLVENTQVGVPVFQSGDSNPHSTPLSVKINPEVLVQTPINRLVAGPQSGLQQSPGLKAGEQKTAGAVTAQPLIASKQQAVPLATNNTALKNQADTQQPARQPPPVQRMAPIVATPVATSPVANKPASGVPLVDPLIKGDTSIPASSGANQPPGIVNVRP